MKRPVRNFAVQQRRTCTRDRRIHDLGRCATQYFVELRRSHKPAVLFWNVVLVKITSSLCNEISDLITRICRRSLRIQRTGRRSGVVENVLENVKVVSFLEAVRTRRSSQRLKVEVTVTLFDVVNLKSKVVALIDGQLNLIVRQFFCVNSSTASIITNRNRRFFNDIHGIAKVFNFSSVVGVGNRFSNRRTTEKLENFLAENSGYKIT